MKKAIALLLSLVIFAACCFGVSATETEKDRLLAADDYLLLDALYRAQGVASDGEYLFFGSNEFVFQCSDILKTTFAGDAVNINPNAIPFEAKLDGCFHVGGIDYHDGKIYAAIEDSGYYNPYIAVFDAESLALLSYKRLPIAITADGQPIEEKDDVNFENGDIRMHMDGVPWVAVDHERGVFYTAEWSEAERLNVFSLDTFEFVGFVELTNSDGENVTLHRCQGADVYGNVLYASCDIGAEQPFFAVDLDTGVMTHLFDRNLGDEAEAEGMCVVTTKDGVRFVSQYYAGIKVVVCTYDVSDLVNPAEEAKEPVQFNFAEKIIAFFKTVFFGLVNMMSVTLNKAA
ncbi:MAG: hypothetical protein IKJ63_08290 [Clostridia bacterium]|nr:hypothetical protein [Clostridia bacterium]